MVRVKICGITNREDALLAVEAGAHALGFVFAESPRKVEPETVRQIVEILPPFISRVGVFVNEDQCMIEEISAICGLDVLQLHGDETPSYCTKFNKKVIKAIRVQDSSVLVSMVKYKVDAFLLDAFVPDKFGGTGRTFDWQIALQAKSLGRIILSGGLDPENIIDAIAQVEPYAVDVSSGIEAQPGKKDPKKLKAFFEAIKEWERNLEGY